MFSKNIRAMESGPYLPVFTLPPLQKLKIFMCWALLINRKYGYTRGDWGVLEL